MSYIKSCNVCGERISLRQMAGGQWVAFDAGSDEPHIHDKKVIKTKNASKIPKTIKQPKLPEDKFSDRSGEIYSVSRIPKEWLDLTPLNLSKLFKKLIEKERRAVISYVDRNKDETTREIYPLSLVEGYTSGGGSVKSMKLVAFCTLRNDYRSFLLSSITEVLSETKIPQSFIKKFQMIEEYEKENILSGSNFYGSNVLHFRNNSINKSTFEDTKEEKIKEQVTYNINKNEKVQSQKDESSEGLIYLGLALLFLILIFG